MSFSVATSITPYMGRGEPRVVIKGAFAFGITALQATNGYLFNYGSRIELAGLATSGTGFSYTVAGRHTLGTYSSPTGLTSIPAPAETPYAQSGSYEGGETDRDLNGFIRMTPNLSRADLNGGGPPLTAEIVATMEDRMDNRLNLLGKLVAPDVTITIDGDLTGLDLTRICGSSSVYWADPRRHNFVWENRVYTWPDGVVMNGWRTYEAHIYDNQHLKGQVVADSSTKVYWDL